MNAVDIAIIGLFAVGVIVGYLRGFIKQLLSIIGLVAAFIAAMVWHDDLSPQLAKWFPIAEHVTSQELALTMEVFDIEAYLYNAAAFLMIFICVKFGLTLIGHMLHVLSKLPVINQINKWSGALLAFTEVFILVYIVIHFMFILPFDHLQQLTRDSQVAQSISKQVPALAQKLHDLWINSPK
jgi:uncharacterized membrane protein required for colicin V production